MNPVRSYLDFVRGFSRNAKLYLWASALFSLTQGVLMVVLNLYYLRVGLQESLLGTLVFFGSIAGVIFALPAGRASDRFGRRGSLLVAGLVAGLGWMVQVLFPHPAILVPCTFISGAAQAVVMVTGGPLLVESSGPEERAHLFGVQAALTMGVSVIGSNLGGLLPRFFGPHVAGGADSAAALRATLLVGVGLFFLALVPVLRMREEKRAVLPVRAAGSSFLNLSDTRLVARLLIPQVLMSLGAGLIMPLQNVFMNSYLGASAAQIGLFFSLGSALTALGALISPLMVQKWGKVRALTGSQLCSLPFLAVMGLVPSLWLYSAAGLVRTALMNMANPMISNFTLEVVEAQERATVNSLVSMSWNLGWAVSGWAGGWLMQNVSYTLPYGFTWFLYLGSILLFYGFFRGYEPRGRRRGQPGEAPAAADAG